MSRYFQAGDVYGDFTVVERTYKSFGARKRGPVTVSTYKYFVCKHCKKDVCSASGFFDPHSRLKEHERIGHSECTFCGEVLTNCVDGSPRRHAFNSCPGKDESFRVLTAFESDIVENFRKLPQHLKDAIKKELIPA